MKYPLTDEAKAAAKLIVDAWNKGLLEQSFSIDFLEDRHTGVTITTLDRSAQAISYPKRSIWIELGVLGLIRVKENNSPRYGKRLDVFLLQELRNAVTSEFEISEYSLSPNAVGNIIINSITGPVQGTGYNAGISNMTIEVAADQLEASLGADFLAQQQALKEAIDALRTAVDSDKQSKLGKVISELGNCLQHGANAYAVTQAITALGPVLRPLLGLG